LVQLNFSIIRIAIEWRVVATPILIVRIGFTISFSCRVITERYNIAVQLWDNMLAQCTYFNSLDVARTVCRSTVHNERSDINIHLVTGRSEHLW
jgi:hypothetical protein